MTPDDTYAVPIRGVTVTAKAYRGDLLSLEYDPALDLTDAEALAIDRMALDRYQDRVLGTRSDAGVTGGPPGVNVPGSGSYLTSEP